MEKKINYLARSFDDIKDELIKFSKKYYPELADDFNDSSVGAWFIDLVAAVGDSLSYHTDRMYQETNIDGANLRSTVMSLARTLGYKVPGPKASICEVELSCVLPVDHTDISKPDWAYAPIVLRNTTVTAGNYMFELDENVNFAEQFNSDGYSNRTMTPSRNGNGSITGYTVTKSAIAVNGNTRVYKKTIYESDLKPFMEFVIPETNVMSVESIIFKESSSFDRSPSVYEYYIDEEEFRVAKEAVMTYRFFECDSLADLYRFGVDTKIDGKVIGDMKNPEMYEDYTEITTDVSGYSTSVRTTRYYKGKWKPLSQKFITEYTDKGYLKVIFGAGNSYDQVPADASKYADYRAASIINNNMLGVLPKAGWTMYMLYRVGGGSSANLGPGAINSINLARVDWNDTENTDQSIKGSVLSSFKVTNLSPAVAGKDAPSIEEIKNLIKYNTSAQNRAVVINDYKAKLASLPPKFGCPFRSSVIEVNNKIEMSFLGLDSNGKLDPALPQTLIENTIEYLSHFKQINDYIEIKSGKIYNIGVYVDVFIDKNYDASDVVSNIINTVMVYFDVNSHDMGDDIFVGDVEKEIMLVDGVLSLIGFRVYKIWNGGYSPDKCPLPPYIEKACGESERPTFSVGQYAMTEEIDLEAIDRVLYSDYNSMYEIRNPSTDVVVRFKMR